MQRQLPFRESTNSRRNYAHLVRNQHQQPQQLVGAQKHHQQGAAPLVSKRPQTSDGEVPLKQARRYYAEQQQQQPHEEEPGVAFNPNTTTTAQHAPPPASATPSLRYTQHNTPHTQTHSIATTAAKPVVADASDEPPLASETPQKNLFSQFLIRQLEPAEQKPTLTVVLDLDETLVSNRRLDLPQAILRPYALEVLNALKQLPGIEIVLWTASTEETATPVVGQLHARGEVFDDVVFRNSVWFTQVVHTKDLRLLGRDMDRVVVFDNAPQCVKLNKQNAVLVEDFTGEATHTDNTLVNLFRVVQRMINEIPQGATVSTVLQDMARESVYCGKTYVPMPETWRHVVSFEGIKPLMIPAHGDFFKVLKTTH